ncbi:peptidoglycan-binding domain-containing protein [Marinobacter adhaerens]
MRQFQAANNLVADGYPGESVLAALEIPAGQ